MFKFLESLKDGWQKRQCAKGRHEWEYVKWDEPKGGPPRWYRESESRCNHRRCKHCPQMQKASQSDIERHYSTRHWEDLGVENVDGASVESVSSIRRGDSHTV